jgi:hypothetical protein
MCVTNRGGQPETVRYRRQQLVSFHRNSRKTRQNSEISCKNPIEKSEKRPFSDRFQLVR